MPPVYMDLKTIVEDGLFRHSLHRLDDGGAARFEAGFMLVNKNEEYGLVDEYGNITVPVEYDELELSTHLTQE